MSLTLVAKCQQRTATRLISKHSPGSIQNVLYSGNKNFTSACASLLQIGAQPNANQEKLNNSFHDLKLHHFSTFSNEKDNNVGQKVCKKSNSSSDYFSEEVVADHAWRQLNHIWTEEEIKKQMATKDIKHEPVTQTDKIMKSIMQGMYHSFNAITGYKHENPTAKSIEWRLIILESFAGVPGFLAAAFRHFYSLRALERDHGSIYTFLEEAENERMHLLVCLKMFKANPVTRALVVAAQVSMTPFLMMTYAISPPAMHRFVGYLEETAVDTYGNIIHHCETEGTHLHREWSHLQAPAIAKSYWALDDNASWVTCLKHILADEAHHRDVNHTFAELPQDAENPFIKDHMKDFDHAVKRKSEVVKNSLMSS